MSINPHIPDIDVRFGEDGLIPVVAQEEGSGQVLMVAWMNRTALNLTLEHGVMHYWSRSRQEIWRKGATSGHEQMLVRLEADCDHDTLLATIKQKGVACHTGRKSCFFNQVFPVLSA